MDDGALFGDVFGDMGLDMDFEIDADAFDFSGAAERRGDGIGTKTISLPRVYAPRTVLYEHAEEFAASIDLDEDRDTFAFVSGDFVFGDFIEALVDLGKLSVKRILVMTLSMNDENIDSLRNVIEWEHAEGIDVILSDYLFAPTLTLFSSSCDVCYIPVGASVTYENGAKVNTSFVTNMEKPGLRIRTSPKLYRAVKAADDANQAELHGELPNYIYPAEVATAASLAQLSKYGAEFEVLGRECSRISALDAMRECGKAIYGGGFLLGDAAAKRRAEAELVCAENDEKNGTAPISWKLSARERSIIRTLG